MREKERKREREKARRERGAQSPISTEVYEGRLTGIPQHCPDNVVLLFLDCQEEVVHGVNKLFHRHVELKFEKNETSYARITLQHMLTLAYAHTR